ncbi:MAG: SIR2 family protein [Armatimonadota bacterium]
MINPVEHKPDLINLLREKRAVLMVGAGSSAMVGYPTWRQLLHEMIQIFSPDIDIDGTIDFLEMADIIKIRADKDNRSREYYKHLSRKFEPRQHHEFHEQLVQLGFAGIATLNYDTVLEQALNSVLRSQIPSIDLCDPDQQYRVFDFMRSLGRNETPTCVMHLHGIYSTPAKIVLTKQDYMYKYERYKEQPTDDDQPRGSERSYSTSTTTNTEPILDTFHRKVLWALLTTKPIVFVGFGMQDEYFISMLKIVQHDFELFEEPVHFALMPYATQTGMVSTTDNLRKYGVQAVFYHVPGSGQDGVSPNHSQLITLVGELAVSVGVRKISSVSPQEIPSVDSLNARWM